MWNPFKKIGGWIDSASNRIAQNQFLKGGPISADDLSPAQKRAYLGMLISSIGSGFSAMSAGAPINIVGNYLAGQEALTENFDSMLRQKKVKEVLQSNMPLEEKMKVVASLGDERTAGVLQSQWQNELDSKRVTGTYQAIDPVTKKVKTYALFKDGTQKELGESPVENVPVNTGGATNIIPRFGPTPQQISHTASPEAIMNKGIQESRLKLEEEQIQNQRWYWEKMINLQEITAKSQSELDRARAQREMLEVKQLSEALASAPKDPSFAIQLAKLPQETRQAIMMHQQVLHSLDQIIEDIQKNGKLSTMDILSRTPRGQNINTLLGMTIEYMKGPLGTGVLQEHEAKRIADILGSVSSFWSLTKDKETILEGLKVTQRMISKSVGAYLMMLQNKLPPELAAAYQREAVAEFEETIKGTKSKSLSVEFDPKTGQWRVINGR